MGPFFAWLGILLAALESCRSYSPPRQITQRLRKALFGGLLFLLLMRMRSQSQSLFDSFDFLKHLLIFVPDLLGSIDVALGDIELCSHGLLYAA